MYFTSSWDDGHPLDLKLADLMASHGIAGTFYCPVRNQEGLPVLAAHELRALDSSFELGSHTRDHVYADRVPPDAWEEQVVNGKKELEEILGHSVEGFCYPGGRVGPKSRTAVEAAGFIYARTIENMRLDCGKDPFLTPTSLQFFPHSRWVLVSNFFRYARWSKRISLTLACLSTEHLDQRIERVLFRVREQNAILHLWGHSWEIEKYGLWPNLRRLFSRIESTIAKEARLTNAALLRVQGLLT